MLAPSKVLTSFRAHFATATSNTIDDPAIDNAPTPGTRPRDFGIGRLNDLITQYSRGPSSAPLAVTGRYRELLYVLVATLITPPHDKTVSIVDFEGRFDPLRLLSTVPYSEGTTNTARHVRPANLDHVHILRPPRGSTATTADCVASMEKHMLYGTHRSRAREWWGTVVIGGAGGGGSNSVGGTMSAPHVAVTAGRKGWLRVDRAVVPTFRCDVSAEEALADREKRQAAVEEAGWSMTSPRGGFVMR